MIRSRQLQGGSHGRLPPSVVRSNVIVDQKAIGQAAPISLHAIVRSAPKPVNWFSTGCWQASAAVVTAADCRMAQAGVSR
jgi:hypothetical protein